MLSPEQEEEVIAEALRRGLLKPEQVELHAPDSRPADPRMQSSRALNNMMSGALPSTTSGPALPSKRSLPTHGPRLDRLRKLGLIDDATIEELRGDLRAIAATAEAAAVTSDERAPVAPDGGPGLSAAAANSPGGAVRVQLPLPDALRRWTRYEITDVLGQGGMGVVYRARDRRLGRTVALKFIRLADPKMVQRFLNEARAQARITHDNICKVYEVDEVAGQPYIAMEYVDGQTVLSLNNSLSLMQKVKLIQDVAEALHSAHRIGIIHRDIKPQNVLVEQRADGQLRPVLMDFGLARDVRSRLNLTETGVVLGTPEYMSPEQARGTSTDGAIDCRTDVYSLGAMLYEMLVGQPPFEGSTSVQVLISVINDSVVPVRARNPGIPPALESVVMKCLRKPSEERYPTARALAEDLGRFAAGQPVVAEPVVEPPTIVSKPPPRQAPPTVRQLRVRPQRWTPAILAGLLLLTLAALVAVGVRARLRQANERRFASEQARQAVLFAKDVRVMELFMRAAYGLPLHNLRSEQDQILQKVQRIESELPSLGPEARGPGEYALGRAAMILDQWRAAETHLQAALKAGFDTPEVHFSLGLTYGVRYQRAADEARRNSDRGWVSERLKELESQYLVRARKHLEQSNGATSESAAYTQALLQYYRGQYEAALESVGRASGEAPWLPEIVQLQARLLRERAAQSGSKDRLLFAEYDLKRAGEILGRAIDMARSNPFLYMEQAELGLLILRQRALAHQPVQGITQDVLSICQRALVAQPDLASVYGLMASAEAYRAEDDVDRGTDPVHLQEGEVDLSEAQRLAPGESGLLPTANQLHRVRLSHMFRRGLDPVPALLRALEVARDAAQRRPDWGSLWVDLGRVHLLRGEYLAAHGQEERPDLDEAVAMFQRAIAKQPQEPLAHTLRGQAELRLALRALNHGEDPLPNLQHARASYTTAASISADNASVAVGQAEAQRVAAEYSMRAGGQSVAARATALELAQQAARQYPDVVASQLVLAQAQRLEAQALLASGQDPSRAITDGLQAVGAGLKLRLEDAELLGLEAELHLLQAQWHRRQRRLAEAALERASIALTASIKTNGQRAASYLTRARVAQLRADLAAGQAAQAALSEGLEATRTALVVSPGSAQALLLQGQLLLAEALRAPLAERTSMAQPALAALEQALKLNPMLGYEGGPARDRARELINNSGKSTSSASPGTAGGPRGPRDQKKR